MNPILRGALPLLALAALPSSVTLAANGAAPGASAPPGAIATVPGMPPVVDPNNLYSETRGPEHLSAAVKDDLVRIYVPNLRGNSVSVIDPAAMKVVDTFPVGRNPQHVVPAWDLRTLWAANNAERGSDGSLTPIDPRTGKPGKAVPVDDPYNLYFTPDGKSAIVVAEARHRLDFRDPRTLALQYQIDAPHCVGINHADFSIDGRSAFFTCEFDGTIAKIDLVNRKVEGYLTLKMPKERLKDRVLPPGSPASEICTSRKGMPQDIRLSPDGRKIYVADMEADGVHIVDAATFTEIGFITTGVAAHGLYPSRDGTKLYIANRGSHKIHGPRNGPGSVSVMDFATEKIVANWKVPGGGSPDMGNVTADGKYLWLSGRYDDVVYRFDTTTGEVHSIPVGQEPHGLAVWPQPGRYSLGHTGNLR
jgi:YVTN family beta-propeller protein